MLFFSPYTDIIDMQVLGFTDITKIFGFDKNECKIIFYLVLDTWTGEGDQSLRGPRECNVWGSASRGVYEIIWTVDRHT